MHLYIEAVLQFVIFIQQEQTIFKCSFHHFQVAYILDSIKQILKYSFKLRRHLPVAFYRAIESADFNDFISDFELQ